MFKRNYQADKVTRGSNNEAYHVRHVVTITARNRGRDYVEKKANG
jgi:hypothetical protein